jgi:uncharacterized protein (TIGR02145 family)
MRKITLTILCALLAIVASGQAPQGFTHQAVIRDANNQLIIESSIGIKVSIIQGSTAGDIVYSETHLPVSNTNGLISFIIGHGTVVSGVFAEIDWASGPYFIETKADPTGGTNYTIEGTSQMLSVPYALHSKTVENVFNNLLPPSVIVLDATELQPFSATLNGLVNGKGFSTTVTFEWGPTTEYGNTITALQSPVTGSDEVSVSAILTGLQSFTNYHYRINAFNAVDVTLSEDVIFTTETGLPQMTTEPVTNILAFSATSGGNITYDGGSPVTARGIVWSTNPSPTLADNFTVDGAGSGSFTSEMTGLTHATTYYVRAYAINTVGTTYGNQSTFTTQNGIIVLTTSVINDVTSNSATSGGNITNDGGTSVIARGVVWSLNPGPTLADNYTEDGNGIGSYPSAITGLIENIHYYVRAYATNGTGTYYGNERSFYTFDCGSLLTDADNNTYNTVLVGNQCWMKENLKTTKYRNGTTINNPTGNTNWKNNTTGAYAWYENDISWKHSYGALYNWHAVNKANGLCPTGWHVPSDTEWMQLVDYVVAQGFPNQWGNTNGAGHALKSCRQVNSPLGGVCNTNTHPRWNSNSTNYGFDEFGFSGLPGGCRNNNGTFDDVGYIGFWWSATENLAGHAWFRFLGLGSAVGDNFYPKTLGFSVRCLRD